jgi:hypothetical protein
VAPYVPRAAADTVLHGVVQEHLETFLAAAAARTDAVGLPCFIERELRGFLRCGVLAHAPFAKLWKVYGVGVGQSPSPHG